MIYNNLLYFLIVIFVVSTDRAPAIPLVPPQIALPALVLLLYLYSLVCRKFFQRAKPGSANSYFMAEKMLSILAVIFFVFILFVFDLKYYLQPLTIGDRMPVFANFGGIAVFFGVLILMWIHARSSYEEVFHRSYSKGRFILANIKINLPIILPWLLLSLSFDLLSLFDLPGFAQLMQSYWGDLVLFVMFLLFLMVFFPPMVRLLWNCKPMPAGPLRQQIEAFFAKQKFSSEILLWPLFEGQMLTAGVMGLIPRFRYVLVTPALLETMNWQELEAILAHEIGHVKKKHILFYILLFLGFSLLFTAAAKPMPFLVLASDWFYTLSSGYNVSPEIMLAFLITLPLLLFMLLYFRFIFGYFIRNFERQADLHVFSVLRDSSPLISSFEKIASLSGRIRDRKNWHHFGIGERIDFLHRCEQDRSCITRHNRKVYLSLAGYFLLIVLGIGLLGLADFEELAAGYEPRYVEAVIMHKLHQEPDNGLWFLLLGDLMMQQQMEKKAVDAYEEALRLQPDNADINNNLAWLLLTAGDTSLHDPGRALILAQRAAEGKRAGHILDTLAVAFWANGMIDEAVAVEMQAIAVDPRNNRYYRQQLDKITRGSWEQEYR
ncbi:MAG: M48 family metalloprotease [Desulfobulbaceae bacterium]|nr:M48 family metalloprotease [Desulfobulbaceae bacterium]